MGRESKRGGLTKRRGRAGQETSVTKMAKLFRDQAGERKRSPAPGKERIRVANEKCWKEPRLPNERHVLGVRPNGSQLLSLKT